MDYSKATDSRMDYHGTITGIPRIYCPECGAMIMAVAFGDIVDLVLICKCNSCNHTISVDGNDLIIATDRIAKIVTRLRCDECCDSCGDEATLIHYKDLKLCSECYGIEMKHNL